MGHQIFCWNAAKDALIFLSGWRSNELSTQMKFVIDFRMTYVLKQIAQIYWKQAPCGQTVPHMLELTSIICSKGVPVLLVLD